MTNPQKLFSKNKTTKSSEESVYCLFCFIFFGISLNMDVCLYYYLYASMALKIALPIAIPNVLEENSLFLHLYYGLGAGARAIYESFVKRFLSATNNLPLVRSLICHCRI